jgi:hypothetical protein
MHYSGFVYIWRDRKNKMFYIGSHMGTIEDGYTGSSVRFKRAYKKRPFDFKRRILSFVSSFDKLILHREEEKWLNMIKVEELGIKYYNLKRVAAGGKVMEHYTEEQKNHYKEKLKKSAGKGKDSHRARKVVCFGKIYETINDAIKEIGFNPQCRLRLRKYSDFYYFDQGPLTEAEISEEKERRRIAKLNGIKARAKGVSSMSPAKRREKGIKAAKTRKLTCLDIGDKISVSLKNKPGRKVSIDGIVYDKGRIAAEKLNMIYGTVKVRLRSKSFPTWFYLDDKTKNPIK